MLARFLTQLNKTKTRLSELMDSVQYVKPRKSKEKELRASAFPVCSLLFVDQYLRPHGRYENKHHSQYHTAVGHMLHDYVQNGVSLASKEIYGSWTCKACSHAWTDVRARPDTCPSCGAGTEEMQYEEISLARSQFGVQLTAHMDGLMLTANSLAALPETFGPDCPEDVYVTILDYKTCSLADAAKLPVPKHLLQLAVYAVLLENAFAVPVNSLSILYAPKDKPSKHIEYSFKVTDEFVDDAVQMIERAMEGYSVYRALVAFDTEVQERGAYSDSDIAEVNTLLDKVYDCRLCSPPDGQSQSTFYEENVKKFFFEGIEDLKTGETKYISRCHLDGVCTSKAGWKRNAMADLQSMDRTPMTERTIRWARRSSLLAPLKRQKR